MHDWATFRLDQVADILDNLRIPVSEEVRENSPGDTPYYGANGLQGFICGHIFDEPLILMAEDGGYFDEYATRPVAYKIEGKSWVNNHAHILRPRENIAFDYLFYSLQHKNITPFIKGGTRAKLNQRELREIEILAPLYLGVQESISHILQTIDQAIEHTTALIDKYQQIKAGLMHELFTRGIGADGKLRPPREQAPELYQQTPIGWIPAQWEYDEVGRLLNEIEQGWSPDCESEPASMNEWGVLKTTAVQWDGFRRFENKRLPRHLKPKENYRVRISDLLLTRAGPNSRVGVVSIVTDEPGKILLSDKLYRLNTNSRVEPEYLALALSSQGTQRFLDGFKTGLAESQTNISQAIVRRLVVALPSKSERALIIQRMHRISSNLTCLHGELEKLRTLKAGLMHDLLTGKVPVTPNTDTKEAADVQN